MRPLAVAFLIALATPAFADSNLPPSYWAYRQIPDAKQEAKAQELMQEIRCLVCQGQSIADSDAELAGDMAIWREKLFSWMLRNAESAMEFFKLPTNRVVELGSQVEI